MGKDRGNGLHLPRKRVTFAEETGYIPIYNGVYIKGLQAPKTLIIFYYC